MKSLPCIQLTQSSLPIRGFLWIYSRFIMQLATCITRARSHSWVAVVHVKTIIIVPNKLKTTRRKIRKWRHLEKRDNNKKMKTTTRKWRKQRENWDKAPDSRPLGEGNINFNTQSVKLCLKGRAVHRAVLKGYPIKGFGPCHCHCVVHCCCCWCHCRYNAQLPLFAAKRRPQTLNPFITKLPLFQILSSCIHEYRMTRALPYLNNV